MKDEIRKALKSQGWDRVRNTKSGEWHGLKYNHPNHASKGKWLFVGWDDQDVIKRNNLEATII
jgi:hypothetical protein